MLEEIVGDIAGEHEKPAGVIRESENSYLLPGATDLDKLDELFHFRVNDVEATTVGGLVSEIAGRIPHPGESFEHQGLRFEVLASTDRRIESVRVTKMELPTETQPRMAIGDRQ
jgi:CBS domain containing-hemolysin-like protein